jgi:hypothetical protein
MTDPERRFPAGTDDETDDGDAERPFRVAPHPLTERRPGGYPTIVSEYPGAPR